jgi:tetratricopeptide (TPR) repeat protein
MNAAKTRSRLVWGGLVLTLAAIVGVVGWWLTRPTTLAPPLPEDILDAEVRLAVDQARQEVVRHATAGTWGRLGMVLMAHLFDAEADLCFQQAQGLDPRDSRWPYCRGIIALKTDPDQAVGFLRQAVERNTWPNYEFTMRLQLVEALLDRGEYEEAERLMHRKPPLTQEPARVDMDLGWLAMARGEKQYAREYFNRASKSPHGRKKALTQLAALARLRNDTAEAQRYENAVVRLKEDSPWPDPLVEEVLELRVGRRSLEKTIDRLEQSQQFGQAAKLYLGQLKSDPSPQNYIGAGTNLARLRDYDRALPLLREAVQRDGNSALAHYFLALTLFRRAEEMHLKGAPAGETERDLREAVQHATEATRLKADYAMAYLIWGRALNDLGQKEAAVVPLRLGLACRSDLIDLPITLAEILLDLGQDAEAGKYLEDAGRLEASDPRLEPLRQRLLANKSKR